MNDIEFIETLKQKRNACDYSQSRLAQELQISRQNLNEIENGKTKASKEMKHILLHYLDYCNCTQHGIRSIAFPSISTGVYSFPVELAAKIAVHTVNRFLQDNPDWFDLVEWVLFDTHTESVYESEVDKIYNK